MQKNMKKKRKTTHIWKNVFYLSVSVLLHSWDCIVHIVLQFALFSCYHGYSQGYFWNKHIRTTEENKQTAELKEAAL